HPSRPRPHRHHTQRPTPQDPRMGYSRRTIQRACRGHRMKPPREFDASSHLEARTPVRYRRETVSVLQRSLLGGGEVRVDDNARFERIELDETAWIDVGRGWLLGADTLLDALVDTVDWKQGRRRMYDRVLDDPRLSRWYQ